MRTELQLLLHDPGVGLDDDTDTNTSHLVPVDDGAAPQDDPSAIVAPTDEPPPETVIAPISLVDADGVPLALSDVAYEGAASTVGDGASSASDPADIDPVQILRDRPDVYAAFYRDFYGPNNDRHSHAWIDRVGGDTPEDYARYWYKTYARFEGYTPSSGSAASPAEDGVATTGRTTIDGIPLSKILSDRPDVFQAFFTEYYGEHNDRHSDAWVQRVGGTTVEDYANYWYNSRGKLEGYHPSVASPAAATTDDSPPAGPPASTEPASETDPSLDPWNHPAVYPDAQAPAGDAGGAIAGDDTAASPVSDGTPASDPFFYSDPGSPMLRIIPGQSFFDGDG